MASLKYLIKEIKYYKELDGGLKRVAIKFLLTRTPLKKIVNTALYNKIYAHLIKKKANKIMPHMLTIEDSSICNARCVMCPYSSMKREKKIMAEETFKKTVDTILPAEKIKYIKFTGLGEPLCDKDLEKRIEYINKNYDTRIILFTNGGLLTKERADNLLKLNIFKINFSINGVKEEYENNMKLNYERTIENIKYFLKAKKDLGNKYPLVNISSVLINEKQKNDFESFKQEWVNEVDSIISCLPSNWSGKVDEKIAKQSFRGRTWACANLWKEIYVNVDGNIVLCDIDYECEKKFGNINTDSYAAIKKNLDETKAQHLKGDFVPNACKNCVSSFDTSVDWWG